MWSQRRKAEGIGRQGRKTEEKEDTRGTTSKLANKDPSKLGTKPKGKVEGKQARVTFPKKGRKEGGRPSLIRLLILSTLSRVNRKAKLTLQDKHSNRK